MPTVASCKDKRIKELQKIPATVSDDDLDVKGLQPEDAALIRYIIATLISFPNLSAAGTANPHWKLHHHEPKKASSPWSIKVSKNWRLLFEYDKSTHSISGLRLLDPHRA